MIQNVLSSIGGVGLYGIVSISLFFAVFVGVVLWAFALNKSHLDAMGRLPLDQEPVRSSSQDVLNLNPKDRHE